MEEILKQILNELKEMRVDINELKQGQNRLEFGHEKLRRVYKVETEIERLSRQ
ncbi:hypothetical protein HPT25_27145 [Bacillus sp. BRMEA1]|uniref:hypothetical protein n=1 Tax=Neobacillus endophyticus TaxID=2738405 RepID=UPI001565020C|nr:hypothetical protein [Neobacillus endophyticus]NRD81001.1 hypothetical protein [Neobacillus endophyticus]